MATVDAACMTAEKHFINTATIYRYVTIDNLQEISRHRKHKHAYSISKWFSSTTITFVIDNRDKYIDKYSKMEMCLWNLWKLLV